MILSCFFSIKMLVFLFLCEEEKGNHIKLKKIMISSDLLPISLDAQSSSFFDHQRIP